MNFSRPDTHEQTAAKEYPPQQPIYYVNWGTAVVVFAMLSLTIIVIYITSRNAESAPFGIVGSVIFFLIGTPIGVLAANGGITEMWRVSKEQGTVRHRDKLDAKLQLIHYRNSIQVVQPQQLPYVPDTDPIQTPAVRHGGRFIPAIPPADDRLKMSCYDFIASLFLESGKPNPKKILGRETKRPFQVQRTKPKKEVLDYLYALNMIWVEEADGMLFFDTERYPTFEAAHYAVSHGIPAGREGSPPSNPTPSLPSHERGVEIEMQAGNAV